MTMQKPNVLDLFCGAGGLSKGFELAGFEIVTANDVWEPALKTYARNHPGTKCVLGNITDPKIKQQILKVFENKKCDVIIGGPPCQAYSIAGLRDPNDPRGRLFEDYVQIVDKLRPKIFIMENVKGILTMKHEKDSLTLKEKVGLDELRIMGEAKKDLLLLRKQNKNNPVKFKFGDHEQRKLDEIKLKIKLTRANLGDVEEKVTDKIKRRFKEIGYDVEFKMLNAADYGVPQKRERVIFISKQENGPVTFPQPTHAKLSQDGKSRWKTVRDAIDDLKSKREDIEYSHIITKHDEKFVRKIKNTPIGKSVFGNYSDSFFRNMPDEPSRTVKENHGGVLVHYEKDRVMTPRELARLQSFRDNFIFEGSKSDILKQIGNAVPVDLAMAIGKHVMKLFQKNN